jgi:hypothetical protein
MKALINPNEEVKYISSWDEQDPANTILGERNPIYTVVGKRICEVAENEFEVASPLFWIDCNNDITADSHYYDEISKSFVVKPTDVERPILYVDPQDQPPTTGTQEF